MVLPWRRGSREQRVPVRIWRQALPAGWLALMSTGATGATVAVADDVAAPAVAAVARHLLTDHPREGVEACRLPICAAVESWRPVADAEDIASSA